MKRVLFISILIVLYHNISTAQEDDNMLKYNFDEIVVTANKVEIPMYEIGNSVTVINREEIENSGKVTVLDILSEIPGISITQQGGPGKLASVFLRGANSNHTLVLIDGVEMNIPADPGNVYDFSSLTLSDVKRIEVLRGPQSTIYGSNALAGVIQIFTRKPTEVNKYFLNLEGGSYSTNSENIGTSGKVYNLSYLANYSRYNTQGFSSAAEKYGNTEKDGFDNNVISTKLGYQFSENISVDFFSRYTKAKADLDQDGGKFGDDPNYTSDIEETLFKLRTGINMFEGKWNQSFSSSYLRNLRKYKDEIDELHPMTSSYALYDGSKLKFEWQNTIKVIDNHVIVAGVETEEERAKSEYNSEGIYGPYNSLIPTNSIRTSGVYAQDQIQTFNNCFLNLGGRYDNHEMFGSVFTYRISPVYIISATKTKLKATYGTGFKAPSLYYLYDPTYGNSELNPEESTGWDAGLEQSLFNEKLSFDITYFNNSFDNLFGFDAVTYKAINIAKVETHGIEFVARTAAMKNLVISFNYTYTDTKDKSENTEDSGLPLLRRPKNKLALIINYAPFDKLNLNAEAIYYGERDDKNYNTFPTSRIILSDYTLLNLAMKYNFYDFLNVNLRFENILDKEYEDIFGYGTAGFSVYAGIGIDL